MRMLEDAPFLSAAFSFRRRSSSAFISSSDMGSSRLFGDERESIAARPPFLPLRSLYRDADFPSVRLDIGRLDHLGPFFELGLHVRANSSGVPATGSKPKTARRS